MKIIHTSDWHLGQYFMGKSREPEHRAFLHWLIEQVQLHRVDAVIIAGDIFDTGTPPSYGRTLYNDSIVALHEAGVQLIIVAGNHDSSATLNESKALLACLGAQVISNVSPCLADQIHLLTQRNGEAGALLCSIPFLRPREMILSQANQSADDKQHALQCAITAHYHTLYNLACQQRDALGCALPIIMTGHLTTVGASNSESVREIYVGSLAAFPTNAFPPADYIALGHIHRPQQVGGQTHIRYSGSPIPLSFDEVNSTQQVLLVAFEHNHPPLIKPLFIPRHQQLASLQGSLNQLDTAIREIGASSDNERPVWLELTVETQGYLSDLHQRLERITADLPVEILRIRRQRSALSQTWHQNKQQTLDELRPEQVFSQRLAAEQLSAPLQQQLTLRYQQIVEEVSLSINQTPQTAP